MSDLQKVFLEEAEELLQQIEPLLLELEKTPSSDVLDELFRIVHTIKGSAGVAGIKGVKALTHSLEDLLEKLRSGELKVDTALTDLLLKAVDSLNFLVEELVEGKDLMPPEALLEEIDLAAGGKSPQKESNEKERTPAALEKRDALWKRLPPEALRLLLEGVREGKKAYCLTLDFGRDFFRQGHNLDYLLDDLTEIGNIVFTVVDDQKIPFFSALDPEDFYLLFHLYFLSEALPEEIENIFYFVLSEENRLLISPLEELDLERAFSSSGDRPPESKSVVLKGGGLSMPQQRSYIVKILRQQEKALNLAEETVLPGLLPTVRRILGRLAEKLGVVVKLDESLPMEEEKDLLLKTIFDLLKVCSCDETGGGETVLGKKEPLTNVSRGEVSANIFKDIVEKNKEKEREKRSSSFRIQQETAGALMSLAGQLVVVKNSLPYLVKELEEMGLNAQARALKERYLMFDAIAREMQDRVMDIWLMPIQEVFGRFPRFVREMTKKLNKKVEVVISGGETRLDRNIVEELYEPLLHLVRNALDHGIEEIEERQVAGKSPAGVISLSAQRQGERVIISISDDGRGIDLEKVIEKALASGAVFAEQLASMEEEEKLKLVFLPGLSTKEGTSELSGRGVGMDVVETKIKKLGGSVHLQSAAGKGTTVILNLPFTMATSEVLIVQMGSGIYGIPLSSIRETVRLSKEKIKRMGGQPVVLWRKEILPLLPGRRFLEQEDHSIEDYPEGESPVYKEQVMVILQQNVALSVDGILSRETVIVKPLKGELKKLAYLMGAAVLGNGHLLLVLNPAELVAKFLEREERGYGAGN